MPLILAIEPDPRQSTQLADLVRRRLSAELVHAATTEGALAALAKIGDRVPDLVLVPSLLSPQEDATIAGALRIIAAAANVRMLTIPLLADAAQPAKQGMFARLTGRKQKATPGGCDPDVFADQIAAYLEEAAAERKARREDLVDEVTAVASAKPDIAPPRARAVRIPKPVPQIVEEPQLAAPDPPVVHDAPPALVVDHRAVSEWPAELPADVPAYDVDADQPFIAPTAFAEPEPLPLVAAEPELASEDLTPALDDSTGVVRLAEPPPVIHERPRPVSILTRPQTRPGRPAPLDDVDVDALIAPLLSDLVRKRPSAEPQPEPVVAAQPEKPDRPEISIVLPPTDVTPAAPLSFITAPEPPARVDEPIVAAVIDPPPAAPEPIVHAAFNQAFHQAIAAPVVQQPTAAEFTDAARIVDEATEDAVVSQPTSEERVVEVSAESVEPILEAAAPIVDVAPVPEQPAILAACVDDEDSDAAAGEALEPAAALSEAQALAPLEAAELVEAAPVAAIEPVIDESVVLAEPSPLPEAPALFAAPVALEAPLPVVAETIETLAAVVEPTIVSPDPPPAVAAAIEIVTEVASAPQPIIEEPVTLPEVSALRDAPEMVAATLATEKPLPAVAETIETLAADVDSTSIGSTEPVPGPALEPAFEVVSEAMAAPEPIIEQPVALVEAAALSHEPEVVTAPMALEETLAAVAEAFETLPTVVAPTAIVSADPVPASEPVAAASAAAPVALDPPLASAAAEPAHVDPAASPVEQPVATPVAPRAVMPAPVGPAPMLAAPVAAAAPEPPAPPAAALDIDPMFFADDALIEPPPTPAQQERSAWIELVESLRQDIERLKTERASEPPPPPPVQTPPSVVARTMSAIRRTPAPPAAPAVKPPKPPKRARRPVEDQWGLFDPEQCGFAALLAKLDEISERENVSG